ncbi:MAG: hypothetical protein J2P32_18145, partial [Actinobacteria bacterium]|nr:hypothetical protein [Actinomycetota bacterium]
DANLELGLPADAREYSVGAQILAELGVRSVRLLTNNPAKVRGLSGFGVEITARVALPVSATADNLRYLIAKRDRLGHQIDGLPPLPPAAAAAAPVPGGGPERAAGVASRREGSYGGASGPTDGTTDNAGQPAGVRDRLPPAGVRDRRHPPVRAVPFQPADGEPDGDEPDRAKLDADEVPGSALACQGGGPARRDG